MCHSLHKPAGNASWEGLSYFCNGRRKSCLSQGCGALSSSTPRCLGLGLVEPKQMDCNKHNETQYTVYPKKYAHGFCLLCFVVAIHWLIVPYPSGLLHWHCGNLTIAPVPAKQPWWIWINTSCEFIMNDCITTTKQSTTKPCAYFLGYTVFWHTINCIQGWGREEWGWGWWSIFTDYFTDEYQFGVNLFVKGQSVKMVSQCQWLMFAWCHNSDELEYFLSDNGDMSDWCFFHLSSHTYGSVERPPSSVPFGPIARHGFASKGTVNTKTNFIVTEDIVICIVVNAAKWNN